MAAEAGWLEKLIGGREPDRPRRRAAVLTITTAVLIALTVLGSRPGVETRTAEQANPHSVAAISDAIVALFLAAMIGGGALLAIVFMPTRWRRRKKGDDEFEPYVEPVRIHWAVKAAFILLPLLLVTGMIAALVTVHSETPPRTAPMPLGGSAPSFAPPQATHPAVAPATFAAGGEWVPPAAGAALLIVVLAVGLWAFRRRGGGASEEAGTPETAAPAFSQDLAAAVDESLDDLRRERDPRRAVIAAYVRLERILARHGLPRRDVETPSEYAARILQELGLSELAVEGLTHLFELARFSRRDIDRSLQDQAIAALVAIREGL